MLVDLAIVAVVGVLATLDLASSVDRVAGSPSPGAIDYILVVAASLSLFWRRRRPVTVMLFVVAMVVVLWLRGDVAMFSVLGLPAVYAAAAHAEDRARTWWALGLGIAGLLVVAGFTVLDADDGYQVGTAVSMTGFLLAAVAAGVVIRNRERIFVDTERRAAEAEADRLAEAQRAVARERSRIAREMHDVVSHGLSVVAVQAAAGREIVHTNPDKAAEVFARIEAIGRESLTELRRMLGVLREAGDDAALLQPQPGLGDLAAFVEQASLGGVTASLVVEGSERPVAPGVALAAYRIAQEALTNVRKHAGTSATATVRLVFEPQQLVVEVADDGDGAASSLAGSGGGYGLVGVRERVEVYGGTLSAGPRRGGGFLVRATLPITTDEAGDPTSTGGDR